MARSSRPARVRAGLTLLVALAAWLVAALVAPAQGFAGFGSKAGEFALERAQTPRCLPDRVRVAPGAAKRVSLGCKGLNAARARVVKAPRHGELGAVSQRRDAVRFRADAGYRGPDRLLVSRRLGGRVFRTAVLIDVGERGSARRGPRCAPATAVARYRGEARIRMTCRGGLRAARVATGPFSGELDEVELLPRDDPAGAGRGGTIVRATYDPESRFAGQETVLIGARGRGGTSYGAATVSVLPWRMRTLGDSVTAGFGYFGDPGHNGFEMSVEQLPDCKPPDAVNNRCSSNSPGRPGYDGGPEWSEDYGLANNVSWAAQFANGMQGGGAVTAPEMFQNLAVTGSAPADWLPKGDSQDGGSLNDELEAIVAEDPDLVALTLGANPLLSDFLLTLDGEECADSDDVAELEACIQPYIDQNQVAERLQRIYTTLLQAPSATVVAMQYHLAIPSANLFEVWQLEVMGDKLNEQVEIAVENTRSALPEDADRLLMVPAQVTPGPTPPVTLPRFNLGLPPDGQGWSPVFDCGDGDLVDGPSHQSEPTQDEFEFEHPEEYCEGDEWIIGADTGIHPSRDGYAQFAAALSELAEQKNLVPRLP